ncbi:hypothetical protein EGW08_019536 [Elysia chlorotica]|uniref:Uncharacterized protein n=1 Tax=Elysia chlorotica TaxID=188477 RepID=A0A433STT5_ELYCH|nr:hypothetical protein EGW08_019536 [Elysia chlorotica]
MPAAQCLHSDTESDKDENNNNLEDSVNTRRRKNVKSLIWEAVFYSLLLTLLVCIAFDIRDQRSYGFHSHIVAATDPKGKIGKMSTPKEMFDWARDYLAPFLYEITRWKNLTMGNSTRATASLATYKIGPTRIRQHRMPQQGCESPSQLQPFRSRCIPSWSSSDLAWADYTTNWKLEHYTGAYSDRPRSPWRYSRWAHVGGTPVAGRLGFYPIGGYVHDMSGTLEEVKANLTELENLHWVDEWTKVVFIETTIYTANINMFALITALFEFPQAMVLQAQLYTHPFKLLTYTNDYPLSAQVFDILIFFAVGWFILRVAYKLYRWRWDFFGKFWHIVELSNLLLAIAVIVLYVGRDKVADKVADESNMTSGQFYNFQTLSMWDQLFGILLGFCCFLSTLKVLHLFRFNRRMSLLGKTLKLSAGDLIGFFVLYILLMMAFVCFSFLVFHNYLYSYSTIMGTIESLLLLALGDLQYKKITSANRVIAPVLITAYTALIMFILLNVLVSILMDAFAAAREAIKNQPNDFELLMCMTKSLNKAVVSPLHTAWDFACKADMDSPRKSDGGSGNGYGMAIPAEKGRKGILALSNKQRNPRFSRAVRFSSGFITDSPRKPVRYSTPKARKSLTRQSFLDSPPVSSIAIKSSLKKRLSTSVNSIEENTGLFLQQLDLIDRRLDSLWLGFVGGESGPPPEVPAIQRCTEVKVTVADVVSRRLGFQDDSGSSSSSYQDGEDEVEDEPGVVINNSDDSESVSEMSIELHQSENNTIIEVHVEHHIHPSDNDNDKKETAEEKSETLSEEMVISSYDRVDDIQENIDKLVPFEDLKNDEMVVESQEKVVPHSIVENRRSDEALNITEESPGIIVSQHDENSHGASQAENEELVADETNDGGVQLDNKTTQYDIESPLDIEEARAAYEDDHSDNINDINSETQEAPHVDGDLGIAEVSAASDIRHEDCLSFQTKDRLNESEYEIVDEKEPYADVGSKIKEDAKTAYENDHSNTINDIKSETQEAPQVDGDMGIVEVLETSDIHPDDSLSFQTKERLNEPEYEIVDETESHPKPSSLYAERHRIKVASKYQRVSSEPNFKSLVPFVIERSTVKQMSGEYDKMCYRRQLDPLQRLNIGAEGALISTPTSRSFACFPDFFNDSGYQSPGDLDKTIEASPGYQSAVDRGQDMEASSSEEQVNATLNLGGDSITDLEAASKDVEMLQPLDSHIEEAPKGCNIGLQTSPLCRVKLTSALKVRFVIGDEKE